MSTIISLFMKKRILHMIWCVPILITLGCTTDQTKDSSENGDTGDSDTNTIGISNNPNFTGRELSGDAKSERVYNPEDRMSETFGKEFDDPATLLSKRVIYFGYDEIDVAPEYQSIISAHANYLAKNRKVTVILEGHTDERGSREYNLALGERRAQSVRQMMQLNVSPNQIEVVSYGEERPSAIGHDEASWQQNRRVEIIYRRK